MRRRRSIRRIAGALCNRAARRALTTWAGWATAEREYRLFKRNSIELMLRRWRQQGVAEAFAAWAGARAEQRRVRHIKARVLALLTHRQLARAWGALWHHRCTTLQLKRVVAIWGHRPLVSAFGRWWEWLEERRRKRERRDAEEQKDSFHAEMRRTERVLKQKLERSAVHRWHERGVGRCFAAWCRLAGVNSFAHSHLEVLMRRVALRLLAAAFGGWLVRSAERRRVRTAALRVIGALSHRQLAMSWAVLWDHRCHSRRLRRMIQAWAHRKLFAAFDAWCAHTDAAKTASEQAEMHEKAEMFQAEAAAAAKAARLKLTRVVVRRWETRGKARCLADWRRWVAERRWRREAEGAAAATARDAAEVEDEHAALLARAKALEAALKGKIAATAVGRWRLRAVGRGFGGWRQWAAESGLRRESEGRVLRQAAARMAQRSSAKCLLAWRQHAADSRRLAAARRKTVLRLRNLALASAVAEWAAWASHSRQERESNEAAAQAKQRRSAANDAKVRRCLERMMHTELGRAFEMWVEHTALALEGQRMVAARLAVYLPLRVGRLFDGWYEWAEEHREERQRREDAEADAEEEGRWERQQLEEKGQRARQIMEMAQFSQSLRQHGQEKPRMDFIHDDDTDDDDEDEVAKEQEEQEKQEEQSDSDESDSDGPRSRGAKMVVVSSDSDSDDDLLGGPPSRNGSSSPLGADKLAIGAGWGKSSLQQPEEPSESESDSEGERAAVAAGARLMESAQLKTALREEGSPRQPMSMLGREEGGHVRAEAPRPLPRMEDQTESPPPLPPRDGRAAQPPPLTPLPAALASGSSIHLWMLRKFSMAWLARDLGVSASRGPSMHASVWAASSSDVRCLCVHKHHPAVRPTQGRAKGRNGHWVTRTVCQRCRGIPWSSSGGSGAVPCRGWRTARCRARAGAAAAASHPWCSPASATHAPPRRTQRPAQQPRPPGPWWAGAVGRRGEGARSTRPWPACCPSAAVSRGPRPALLPDLLPPPLPAAARMSLRSGFAGCAPPRPPPHPEPLGPQPPAPLPTARRPPRVAPPLAAAAAPRAAARPQPARRRALSSRRRSAAARTPAPPCRSESAQAQADRRGMDG